MKIKILLKTLFLCMYLTTTLSAQFSTLGNLINHPKTPFLNVLVGVVGLTICSTNNFFTENILNKNANNLLLFGSGALTLLGTTSLLWSYVTSKKNSFCKEHKNILLKNILSEENNTDSSLRSFVVNITQKEHHYYNNNTNDPIVVSQSIGNWTTEHANKSHTILLSKNGQWITRSSNKENAGDSPVDLIEKLERNQDIIFISLRNDKMTAEDYKNLQEIIKQAKNSAVLCVVNAYTDVEKSNIKKFIDSSFAQ